MPSCTCASASRLFTTNSQNDRNTHEKTLVFTRIKIRAFRNTVFDDLYPCGDEPMELAHAGAVRLACHHLLAGLGTLDSQQNPLWRIPRRPASPLAMAPPNDGAMGADDSGGA